MDWNSISLKQYKDILDILDSEPDQFVASLSLVDVLFGVDSASLPIAALSSYLNQLDFLKTPYKPKAPKKEVVVDGVTYETTLDISEITTGQYIDFQEFLKRKEEKQILNVLFIKKGEKYGDSDNSEALYNGLRFTDYADQQFFFIRLLNDSMKATLRSSISMTKRLRRRAKTKEEKEKLTEKLKELETTLLELSGNDFIDALK